MKVDIVRHPQIDYFIDVLKTRQFPADMQDKIRGCIVRARVRMMAEGYGRVPEEDKERYIAQEWASAYRNHSEGFTFEPVEFHGTSQEVELETSLLGLTPEIFKELVFSTFSWGKESYQHQHRIQNNEFNKKLDLIKKDIDKLEGLSPDELKDEAKSIIDQYK